MIQVSVNDEPRAVAEATLLSSALQAWGYGSSQIAVAINHEFVPRSTYQERELKANDQIDIVHPVGGG